MGRREEGSGWEENESWRGGEGRSKSGKNGWRSAPGVRGRGVDAAV